MEEFNNLIKKLEKKPLDKKEFNECIKRLNKNFDTIVDVQTLNFLGLPIEEDEEKVYLRTKEKSYKDETFCIVDIETNGNSPIKNQIIEIGAIKIKNSKIIDKFESYIYADHIPSAITKLTQITTKDLKDAPSLKKVLYDFKLFLGDAVFVAHNVNFDFNFISDSMKVVGLEKLLNRKFCTIDLSRKTIKAPKHGLAYLREHLDIKTGDHHRAYSDALSAAKILLECFKHLPNNIKTTEDLINFSNNNQQKKKKQKNQKPQDNQPKKEESK